VNIKSNHGTMDREGVKVANSHHKITQTVPITHRHSGEVRAAQIFVAALGANNYTCAEASWK